MSEMRSLSESAEAWLCNKNPMTWLRAHFSTRCKFDMLLYNNSECFNKIILKSRDKPIVTMLEIIRRKVMTRLVSMREVAEKHPRPLCLGYKSCLKLLVNPIIYAENEKKYEVYCGLGNKQVVDLVNSSYSCKKWDLLGISCPM